MQTSYGRHDRGRHRYCSSLCARQHRRDRCFPVGRVHGRMVHRTAARVPPRGTARRRVTYRAAMAHWPSWPDLVDRWPSRLVATAAEDRLIAHAYDSRLNFQLKIF
jgi:hypothetical protein